MASRQLIDICMYVNVCVDLAFVDTTMLLLVVFYFIPLTWLMFLI